MFDRLFRPSQGSPRLAQRVADMEQECVHLAGLVKQLRRDLDELDEATARRFKRIAARNAASAGGQDGTEPVPKDGAPPAALTWRERLARRRNGNAEIQEPGR